MGMRLNAALRQGGANDPANTRSCRFNFRRVSRVFRNYLFTASGFSRQLRFSMAAPLNSIASRLHSQLSFVFHTPEYFEDYFQSSSCGFYGTSKIHDGWKNLDQRCRRFAFSRAKDKHTYFIISIDSRSEIKEWPKNGPFFLVPRFRNWILCQMIP